MYIVCIFSVYMNYLNKPLLPSAEVLEKNHRKRISNHQILKIFYQLLAFGGVLYIVYMISFENRDPQSYTFKKHVEDMMGFDAVSEKTMVKVLIYCIWCLF